MHKNIVNDIKKICKNRRLPFDKTLSRKFIKTFSAFLEKKDFYLANFSSQFILRFKNHFNRTTWYYICKSCSLDIIDKCFDKLNTSCWSVISNRNDLNAAFIIKYKDHLLLDRLVNKDFFTIDLIEQFITRLDFYYISRCPSLTLDFIRKYKDRLDWYSLSTNSIVMDNLEEFIDYVNWGVVSKSVSSEDFLRKYFNKIQHKEALLVYKYPKDLFDRLDSWFDELSVNEYWFWRYLPAYQNLTDNFIKRFWVRLDWGIISQYQELSEDTMREFKYLIRWDLILKNDNIEMTESFYEEMKKNGFIKEKSHG